MYNTIVKKLLKDSGYDCNWPISEDHILSLMQASYNAGKIGQLIVNCPVCDGKGYIQTPPKVRNICHACNGKKTVLITGK